MRIGVINMPGRNSYDGQSLRTRFFILGLPLFPTGCIYKISDNLGIDIPLRGIDVLHAYAKIHFGLLGFGGLMLSSSMRGSNVMMKSVLMLLCLGLVGFCIYSWVAHSSVNEEEEVQRKIFGKAFLYNMSPEYLPNHVQKSLFNELLKVYFGKFAKLDWEADIRSRNVNKENYPLLYTLAYYQKTIAVTPTNEALFAEVAAYLEKGKQFERATTTASNQGATASAQANFATPVTETPRQEPRTAYQSTTHTATGKGARENTSANTKQTDSTPVEMSSKDIFTLHDARQSIVKQLFMVAGFFLFGFIIAAIFTGGTASLGIVFLICLTFYGVISAAVFLPSYMKIGRDITNRKKISIKVRIRDMAEEFGTAYLILQSNRYGIKKLTAPAKYYSTGLLNKELEIYVGKESHTLLEIVGARY
ncbi:MAG: hypothetical protein ACRBG0_08770 [Lewinella sp.]|uniref:hypothetical protein n=1 Tax=Lewinella sp. TaxID=2004506 RepID=UPI003D6AC682